MNNILQNFMDFLGFDDPNDQNEEISEEKDIVANPDFKDKVVDLQNIAIRKLL